MTNFWNNKTLNDVVRAYLDAALDELEGSQPMNIDGLVKELCGNITIKNNAKTFVADYFDDAIDAVAEYHPERSFRYSQYERTANLMLLKAAREVLSGCETAQQFDDTYHIWKTEDIEALRVDLEVAEDTGPKFQRACDVNFESLESYAYRFLDYALPKMVGKTVKLDELALEMPLVNLSDSDARKFLKSNFNEAMELLDKFRDSGYKVDYTNPAEMMQNIMYQKQKEILAENPYIVDLIEYDGVKTLTIDEDFVDNLKDNLEKQKSDIKLSKFGEMPTFKVLSGGQSVGRSQMGRIIDLRKGQNRVEILY